MARHRRGTKGTSSRRAYPAGVKSSPPHRMKTYESFDAFLVDQSRTNQAILRSLRGLVRRTGLPLEEGVKWGNGCWIGVRGPVAYAHCEPDHVQFGFFSGASLSDPKGLLEGKGRFIRHVKLVRPGDVDPRPLGALLRQAAAQR